MKTHHRTVFALIALLAVGGGVALAQPSKPPRPPKVSVGDRDNARFEEVERQTLRVPNVTQLDLSNISGDIVINAGSGSEAVVEVVKRGFGETQQEAREQLSYLDVRLHVSEGGRGEVRANYTFPDRKRHRFRSSADYTVTAPAGTAIFAKSISGSIRASRMTGELSVESVSGEIRLESPARVSTAKSVSGDVLVSGANLDGTLVASSVSGTVRLEALKARRIEASSVSGNIVLSNTTCERASGETVSGSVEYTGAIARGGRYEFQAHSGDITFTAKGNVGFDIEANSFSGNIRSDLPISNLAVEGGSRSGRRPAGPRRDAFRGTYGDGSATVELSTFSGNILIGK
jgi:hypothetical protein